MAWDREYLKGRIKVAFGMDRDADDGLLTDALIHEAINDAMKIVADDCDLIDGRSDIALREGQWKYPYDDRALSIRAIWWKDENGEWYSLKYIEAEEFMEGYDPTETDDQPLYFSYPHFQGPVFNWYAKAPPAYDFIGISRVTKATKRTLVDSGASFGRTWSGNRIIPKSIVYNLDDGSYGYADILDMESAVATGTAGATTDSATLADGAKDFVALGVEEGWIICSPSSGTVTKWGFITNVYTTYVEYEDYEGDYFAPGDTYKIGPCDKIWLSYDAPYRGLRHGSLNKFSAATATATISVTTFTETRCTGTISGTASVGQEAIASGGSHGKIETVESGYVDVEYWVGGQPVDGETVSVQTCDEYTIQSRFRTERVFWLRPTPNADDTRGEESLHILYNDTPILPDRDTDPIEIPEHYFDPLFAACMWQCTLQKGSHSLAEVTSLRTIYREVVKPYLKDANRPPRNEPLRPFESQVPSYGKTDVGPSGIPWDWQG